MASRATASQGSYTSPSCQSMSCYPAPWRDSTTTPPDSAHRRSSSGTPAHSLPCSNTQNLCRHSASPRRQVQVVPGSVHHQRPQAAGFSPHVQSPPEPSVADQSHRTCSASFHAAGPGPRPGPGSAPGLVAPAPDPDPGRLVHARPPRWPPHQPRQRQMAGPPPPPPPLRTPSRASPSAPQPHSGMSPACSGTRSWCRAGCGRIFACACGILCMR